jgi:hypothetical protein
MAMILISAGCGLIPHLTHAHTMLRPFQNRTASHSGVFLEPRVGFFSTSENFNESGNRIAVADQVTVTRISLDVNLTYGVTDDWFLFGRLSALSNRISNPSGTGERSAFNLSDQLIGSSYRVLSDSGLSLNVQGELTIPAYSNESAALAGSPYMGDGSLDVTGGLFAEIPVDSEGELLVELGGGYTHRSKGFSGAIPWTALFKRDPIQSGFLFEAGMLGQISLKTDADATRSSLLAASAADRAQGAGMPGGSDGSYLLQGINPAFLMIAGKAGFKSRAGHGFYASAAYPVSGSNVPFGISVMAGALFDLSAPPAVAGETGPPRQGAHSRPASRVLLTPERRFRSYDLEAKVTSYNDSLFLLKINKGAADMVENGQLFDIFSGKEPIARAQVSHVRADEAALTVLEYYQDTWIEKGSIARRVVR